LRHAWAGFFWLMLMFGLLGLGFGMLFQPEMDFGLSTRGRIALAVILIGIGPVQVYLLERPAVRSFFLRTSQNGATEGPGKSRY